VVPITAAVNVKPALGSMTRLEGEIDTAAPGTATVTVALSIFEVSATLDEPAPWSNPPLYAEKEMPVVRNRNEYLAETLIRWLASG